MLPLIAAAAPIAGGIIGNIAAGGDEDAARNARQQALQTILGVGVPSVEEQRIALQTLVNTGDFTPEALDTIQQEASRMEGVSVDPRLKQAQMQALLGLQKQSTSGLTSSDRQALGQITRTTALEDKAKREAILQNMAARGAGGSGAELAAQLASVQAGNENAAMQGNNLASMANERALQALAQSGQLGGQMRSQGFGEDSAKAQAADAINRFNAANRQSVAGTNVGARNTAGLRNVENTQSISNSNVGLKNQQEIHNKALIQQKFDNELRKAQAAQGAYGNVASGYDSDAANTRQMWSNIGNGVGQGASAYGAYKTSNPSSGNYSDSQLSNSELKQRQLARGF